MQLCYPADAGHAVHSNIFVLRV